jgi:pimeloyl-ACP methyl ester carboxylesterase/DNA-binding SARP family transcriptional activator
MLATKCNRQRGGSVKEMQIRDGSDLRRFEAKLFGVPSFLCGGRAIAIAERKNRALLSLLTTSPGVRHSRDRLVELLWPDSSVPGGRASLRQALSSIRSLLEDGKSELIIADREAVMLNATLSSSDVHDLERLATLPDPRDLPVPNLRGTFLEGLSGFSPEFDSWRVTEQARLARLALHVLQRMADCADTERRPQDAAAYLTQALELEPMNEPLTRVAMEFHARHGNSAKALELFRILKTLTETELGVPPERVTLDLARSIRAGRLRRTGSTGLADARHASASLPHAVRPHTQYAKAGPLNIAYQTSGSGPVDLIYVSGWISNVELAWSNPAYAHVLERLGSFARVTRFDKRGTGLSDRNIGFPTLEQRMDDIRAVMDAAGIGEAVLFGSSEGGNLSMLFAATYPERTRALVLYGAFARGLWAPDYPWAKTAEQVEDELAAVERDWGGAFDLEQGAPSIAEDRGARDWFATFLRQSASPQDALSLWRWNTEIDMRAILPAIHVPTLVLHRTGDRWVKLEEGRFLAERIDGARLVELPGDDHLIWVGDADAVVDRIENFVTRSVHRPIRTVLATLLCLKFLPAAKEAEDGAWQKSVQANIVDSEGRIHTLDDGTLLAVFPGPSQAINCAYGLADGFGSPEGMVRSAVHIGECLRAADGSVEGDAVDMVKWLVQNANPGQILVSQTVRDLVVGSSIKFLPVARICATPAIGEVAVYSVDSVGKAGAQLFQS